MHEYYLRANKHGVIFSARGAGHCSPMLDRCKITETVFQTGVRRLR